MFHSATQDNYQIKVPSSFNNYKIIKELGNGSTCVTVLVEDQNTSQEYAAKIISKNSIIGNQNYQTIINEYIILSKISHQNIIKFIEMFEITNEEDEEFIIFIIEYCSNGDLLSFIKENHVDEKTKKRIIQEMLSAIKYLHENEISHGDIKVENILLDSELHAKLCDFGYCKTSVIAGDNSKTGTLYYAAPELFVPLIPFNTLKADIYAIGITIYAIFELQFPFKDGDQACIIKQIVSGEYSIRKEMDKQLQVLFEQCTKKQAFLRPTIDQIINDEFFSNKNESETTSENSELISNEVEV